MEEDEDEDEEDPVPKITRSHFEELISSHAAWYPIRISAATRCSRRSVFRGLLLFSVVLTSCCAEPAIIAWLWNKFKFSEGKGPAAETAGATGNSGFADAGADDDHHVDHQGQHHQAPQQKHVTSRRSRPSRSLTCSITPKPS